MNSELCSFEVKICGRVGGPFEGPRRASGCQPSDKKSELTLMKTGNWQNRSVEEKMEESTPQSPEKYIPNNHRSQTAKAGGWNRVKQEVDQEGGLVSCIYTQ